MRASATTTPLFLSMRVVVPFYSGKQTVFTKGRCSIGGEQRTKVPDKHYYYSFCIGINFVVS